MNKPLLRTGHGIPGYGIPAPALLCVLALAGCAAPVVQETARLEPAEWSAPAPDENLPLFQIDREESLLLIRVDPAGPMARLGHSHVIGTRTITGFVQPGDQPEDTRAALSVELTDLVVDRPEWRAAWGLDPEMDPEDIEGTRANLLGEKLLNAAQWPRLEASIQAAAGLAWLPEVTARIRLRGQVRQLTVPVAVFRGPDRIEVVGEFAFEHADFGLEPFSAAGGALRVAETIRVRFRIVAKPAESDQADVAIIDDFPATAPGTIQ